MDNLKLYCHVDMMALLAARNVRIHLCVTVCAKCDSALYWSFGHLGGNLDSSGSSEALICFVELVNMACGEFFLFFMEFGTSGISVLE